MFNIPQWNADHSKANIHLYFLTSENVYWLQRMLLSQESSL